MFNCIFILSLLGVCVVSENFFQLVGYIMVADNYIIEPSTRIKDCLLYCEDDANCVGAEFDGQRCYLFERIRNIIESPKSCSQYVFDRINVTQKTLGLSKTDELVYFNAYLNQSCPYGFEKKDYGCTWATTVCYRGGLTEAG